METEKVWIKTEEEEEEERAGEVTPFFFRRNTLCRVCQIRKVGLPARINQRILLKTNKFASSSW